MGGFRVGFLRVKTGEGREDFSPGGKRGKKAGFFSKNGACLGWSIGGDRF